ncbi:hypothetical protein Tco_0414097 [Tanacetum coccineum]
MMMRMANIPSLKLNEDECFDPGGGEIDADIPSDFEDDYYNSEGDTIYLRVCLLMTLSLISFLRIAPDYEYSRA